MTQCTYLWTGSVTQCTHPVDRFCDSVYLPVDRFCGKHSRLKGHSVADCIHLTGIYFGRNILLQDQLDILQSNDNFVFLSGNIGWDLSLIHI